MKRKVVVIAGPTAVGKTELAIRAANDFNGEIISCDSMQLYKYMDIGSAKPDAQERAAAKHYLVDEIDPAGEFSVAEYCRMAKGYIEEVFEKGKLPIISGGTGLYINSLIYDMDFASTPKNDEERSYLKELLDEHGPQYLHDMLRELDPDAADRIHPNNTKKMIRAIEAAKAGEKIPAFEESFVKTEDYDVLLICLDRDRQQLYDRINLRVDIMMEKGLIPEIKSLMTMGLTEDSISMKGIGYKELIAHFNGEYDLETAVELIKRNSRRYAKRQLTWFRRYPDMHWFDLSADVDGEYDRMCQVISEYLEA